MSKLRMFMFTALAMLFASATAFAADAGTGGYEVDNTFTMAKWARLAAGIGFAIAAGLGALGQSRVAASAAEGAARNPGASGRIQILMIIGLAFIETLVIFTLVIMFAIVGKGL